MSSSSPIRLNYRSIYILPTKRGLGFCLLLLLLLLIAFVYNNNLVYLFSFLLASLFVITSLHTVQSLAGLMIRKGHSPDIFVSDFAQSKLIIENPDATTRYSVQLSLNKEVLQSIDIAARETAGVSLAQKVVKRGWFIADQPTISCCYPFGLFRAWRRLNIELKTLVYPQPLAHDCPLPENHSSDDSLHGSALRGQEDFYGLQSYHAGDNIRHIHWRSLAKGQGLYIKQYSGAQSSEVWLDYELTTGADHEARLSQMCRWVLDADKAGVEYGFKLAGLSLEPNRGELHSTQCLQALALA